MSLKKQLTHLKKIRKLAKLRKIKKKSETLVENTSFLLEDKSTKSSLGSKNNTLFYKNFDQKENNNFEDNMKITLDIDTFTRFLKFA